MAKSDRPVNFKGVVAVLSVENRIGYRKGDLIDFVMDEADVGSLVWDDPRFKVVFMPGKTAANMENMFEPLKDVDVWVAKRRYSYDLEDVELKDALIWDFETLKTTEQILIEIDQPPVIEIP
jgi:hypothetical protein